MDRANPQSPSWQWPAIRASTWQQLPTGYIIASHFHLLSRAEPTFSFSPDSSTFSASAKNLPNYNPVSVALVSVEGTNLTWTVLLTIQKYSSKTLWVGKTNVFGAQSRCGVKLKHTQWNVIENTNVDNENSAAVWNRLALDLDMLK